jgi:hypothetical protein
MKPKTIRFRNGEIIPNHTTGYAVLLAFAGHEHYVELSEFQYRSGTIRSPDLSKRQTPKGDFNTAQVRLEARAVQPVSRN